MPTRRGKPGPSSGLVAWRPIERRPLCPAVGEVVLVDDLEVEHWLHEPTQKGAPAVHRFYLRRADELLAMADDWYGVQVLLGWVPPLRWQVPPVFAAAYTGRVREREAPSGDHAPLIRERSPDLRARARRGFGLRCGRGPVFIAVDTLDEADQQWRLLQHRSGVRAQIVWRDTMQPLTQAEARALGHEVQ